MTRPWIEFIQAQNLPWQPDDLNGTSPGVEVKILSRDTETGAASLLVRYPAGWAAPPVSFACEYEFLVLEGELSAGDTTYGPFAYGHWPAGYSPGPRQSK